ncbi:hypothetical protein A5482_009675 [Cyanobacterium sp. IPPAS B-1200]|uniref:hypothetical protein n=1 Tax=Cyanobacterium sp. IPPAS B-1200 TaxID=1562720 RepID=UPI000868B5A3|nr:hypothetical protein [Cyanobacterium sp. IPPAS B-1200]OEJ80168.1 hypothetical protein A5482_06825 [Cyanobacterium sp. IPPAS B-1200]
MKQITKIMKQITINVDEHIYKAFHLASQTKKQELSDLISVYLDSFWKQKNLIEVMETIADNAEKRGLTSEILAQLLED